MTPRTISSAVSKYVSIKLFENYDSLETTLTRLLRVVPFVHGWSQDSLILKEMFKSKHNSDNCEARYSRCSRVKMRHLTISG